MKRALGHFSETKTKKYAQKYALKLAGSFRTYITIIEVGFRIDNTNVGLVKSQYHTQTHSIIA